MEEVTMYKTSDGETFLDADAAEAHEKALADDVRIEKFLDKNYPKPPEGQRQGAVRAMAKKAVQQFLAGGF